MSRTFVQQCAVVTDGEAKEAREARKAREAREARGFTVASKSQSTIKRYKSRGTM
jgi:hypothetical protein